MNQEYFTLWILDEILGLPRDVIRWEIWDYIDYRFVLTKHPNTVLSWICENHEFEIGTLWAHHHKFDDDDEMRINIDKMYNEGNMERVNWLLEFFIPLVKESDQDFYWLKYYWLYHCVYCLMILCCRRGDIDTIKKISPEYIDKIADMVVYDCQNHGRDKFPLYESWSNHHKSITEYLWNNRCGCGNLIYDEENDTLIEIMDRLPLKKKSD